MKKSFFQRIGCLGRKPHRAASAFLSLARRRYSWRNFSDKALLPEVVDTLLEAARLAPTAANRQPVHVWALCSEEALGRIRQVHATFDAPLVLMVGCKPSEAWVRSCDGKNEAETDAAIVGTHIILQAADLGLGSVWIGAFDPAKVRALFPETDGYEITALFAVGYAAPDDKPNPRHDVRQAMASFATKL